jgi:hypothetical protein
MSTIKRYQAALRHRTNPRYMTRDFIVPLYTGTEPDILDDSNTQRETGVYKDFPNEMPIVSPKEIQNQPYEQLNLANGGRANFSEGSKLTGTDKTLEQNIKDDHKAFNDYRKSIGQSTIPLDNAFIKMWQRTRLNEGGRVGFKKGGKVIENNYLFNFMKENSGISNFEKAKKLNKLKFTNSQGGKITDSYLEKFITQNQELKGLGARSAAFTLDEVKQYARPKQLQDFKSGLIDEETFRTRVNQYRGDLKKTPEQKELYRKINYERMKNDPEKKARIRERQLIYNEKKYLEQGMYPPAKNPKDAFWRDLLRSADVDDRVSLVGERPNKYPRDVFESLKLKDNETGKTITYKNLTNHPEYNKAIKPYQIKFAINQSELSPETRKKITYQRTEGGNKSNIVIQHNQGLGKNPFNTSLAIQGENIQESLIRDRFEKRFNAAETLSDKKQAINLFKKDLEQKAPNILSQPGKKAYGAETDVEGLLKTSKVPAGERRRLVQMIGSIGCPTYAIGGRVNFSEGTDCYNKGLKALEEGNLTKPQLNVASRAIAESGEESMLLKNLLSKAGSGVKFTGLGVKELISVGAGPIGLGVGALLESGQAIPELAKGDWREAIRSTTLGFLPESVVGSRRTDLLRIAKTDEEKNAAQLLFDYQDKVDEANRIQGQIEALKNPEFASVEGYEPDPGMKIKELEGKLKDLDSFLNLNEKKVNKVTPTIVKLSNQLVESNRSNIINPATGKPTVFGKIIGTTSVQDKSKLSEDIQKQIYQESEPDEKTIPFQEPNIVGPDDSMMQNQYNNGGRVGLAEGSGPKMGRRGFIGLLGALAATPLVKSLMKGEKATQATKVAAKVLPKVADMPEWFNPLVTKIMKEGVDISPKATRVEDIRTIKKIEVPVPGKEKPDVITMTQYPNGSIHIEADVYGGAFDAPFDLYYKPPKADIDLETGKAINDPGEFSVLETRPRPAYEPGDFELEYENMSVKDAVSDLERIEKIATNKRIHPKRVEQREKARTYVQDNPYDDIMDRYPEPDPPDWWEK